MISHGSELTVDPTMNDIAFVALRLQMNRTILTGLILGADRNATDCISQ